MHLQVFIFSVGIFIHNSNIVLLIRLCDSWLCLSALKRIEFGRLVRCTREASHSDIPWLSMEASEYKDEKRRVSAMLSIHVQWRRNAATHIFILNFTRTTSHHRRDAHKIVHNSCIWIILCSCVDVLGLLSLYYVLCNAKVADKVCSTQSVTSRFPVSSEISLCTQVKAVFALFDFDDDRAMSKDELVRSICTYWHPHLKKTNFPPFLQQTILFVSTGYSVLAFLDRLPRNLILLNKFKRDCEKLALDGFTSRQVCSTRQHRPLLVCLTRQRNRQFWLNFRCVTQMNVIDKDGNIDGVIGTWLCIYVMHTFCCVYLGATNGDAAATDAAEFSDFMNKRVCYVPSNDIFSPDTPFFLDSSSCV